MPEIGEVARIVHFIKKYLVGKTIAKVTAQVDENVYGKVGCSAELFEKAMHGKTVLDARRQGKYFWMVMSSPPHPLLHFGMAGWFKFNKEDTLYYRAKDADGPQEWPPKYWKFLLETDEEPSCQAAFVDFRRFARIRLIDCNADDIRSLSPLIENGPDPVEDEDILTVDWLTEKLHSKRIPVKALLLDQANISGIGNWVGDEILYDAKIHPEQYSNTLSTAQIAQLHKSIMYVCKYSVEHLADSSTFPEEWLFKHRWGKGKKDSTTSLPNGKRFVFLTVGGRTSCVVPSVQKKTGPVAGDVKQELAEKDADSKIPETDSKSQRKSTVSAKRSAKVKSESESGKENGSEAKDEEDQDRTKHAKKRRKVKNEGQSEEHASDAAASSRTKTSGRRSSGRIVHQTRVDQDAKDSGKKTKKAAKSKGKTAETGTAGRRRSARISR